MDVNRALISDASGKVAVSNITSTELSYLDGVSSNVQDQLDNRYTKIETDNAIAAAIGAAIAASY